MTLQEIYDAPIPNSVRMCNFQRQLTLDEDEYKAGKILIFLADKFSEFENREDMHVLEVHMPLEDYAIFKSLPNTQDVFDPCGDRERIINQNYVGALWGAEVKVKKEYKSIELI